jgi:hypothetical protein
MVTMRLRASRTVTWSIGGLDCAAPAQQGESVYDPQRGTPHDPQRGT